MEIIYLIENFILFISTYGIIGLILLVLLLLVIVCYLVYFFNYLSIKNTNIDIYPLYYEIIRKYKLEQKWIEVEGIKISVIEKKSNLENVVPIFFIHGTFSASPTFYELITLLPEEFHCICIDLPNFGISDFYKESICNLSLIKISNKYADTIYKIVKKMGFNKINLVGHSLGAIISLHLALKYRSAVNELFLLSIPGLCHSSGRWAYYSGIFFKYLLPPKLLRLFFVRPLIKPILYYFKNSDIFVRFWLIYSFNPDANGNDIIGNVINQFIINGKWKKPLLPKILRLKCRTHLWIGSNDYFLDEYNEDLFRYVAPHITIKKINNVGHNVHNNYNDFIPEFLRHIDPTTIKKDNYRVKLKYKKFLSLKKQLKSRKNQSFPSLKRTEELMKKNYMIIGKILK